MGAALLGGGRLEQSRHLGRWTSTTTGRAKLKDVTRVKEQNHCITMNFPLLGIYIATLSVTYKIIRADLRSEYCSGISLQKLVKYTVNG